MGLYRHCVCLLYSGIVFFISRILNNYTTARACWVCPFCELACLGICERWRWLLLGIFAEVAKFWPLYIALVTGAYSKAEFVLEVFLPLDIKSVQTASSAVLTWHAVPSTTSPASLLIPGKVQWLRRYRTCRLLSTHFCNAFCLIVVTSFLFVD